MGQFRIEFLLFYQAAVVAFFNDGTVFQYINHICDLQYRDAVGYEDQGFITFMSFEVFQDPGDGSLWVLSTSSWEVEAKIDVGGSPTRILGFYER